MGENVTDWCKQKEEREGGAKKDKLEKADGVQRFPQSRFLIEFDSLFLSLDLSSLRRSPSFLLSLEYAPSPLFPLFCQRSLPHLIARPPQPGINQYTCLLLARTLGSALKPNRREELTAGEEKNDSRAGDFAWV